MLLLAACSDDGGECIAPEPAPEAPLDEVLAGLDGLPFDVFLDASYEAILRRSPEAVSSRGLSEALATGNDLLDDLSDEYVLRTMELVEAIQTRLRAHDRNALTRSQQLSYDTYDWFLSDQLRWRELLHYDYTTLVATYSQLYYTLVTVHPVEDIRDAEDYVARLRRVSRQIGQVRDKLAVRAQQGIMPPVVLLQPALAEAEYLAGAAPRELAFYTAFQARLDTLPGLSQFQRQDLLAAAEDAIACHVIPSFGDLSEDLRQLLSMAPLGLGAEQYPGGVGFYAAELAHHTTTEVTAAELHELGQEVLLGLHAAMRAHFTALGYPEGEPLQQLYERLAADTGVLFDADAVAGYEAIIADAETRLADVFAERPAADLVVIGVANGDYYLEPALDGSRPGAFYASVANGVPRYAMPTLAYHEGVPGHHMQVSFAQTLALPDFRRDVGFTAYVEGWAHYTEELAAELGWYEDDIPGELGRLQGAALRAARLVVDTGIHAQGWGFEQAVAFMVDNIGSPTPAMEREVMRYVSRPGQATAYWVGKQRILELRQQAMDEYGDAFSLELFHSSVLRSGALPLDVLSLSVPAILDELAEPAPPASAVAASRTAWPAMAASPPRRSARHRAQPAMPHLLDCATRSLPHCAELPRLRNDAVPARVP
jgi:uncharacterized protein (DUF885 family)